MNGAVIHPGDKVTVAFSLSDEKDLPHKKENAIHRSKALLPDRINSKDQENQSNKDGRPPLISRRTSSLLTLNIEGLLVVPEYEKRLRRKSYGGCESDKEAPKETAVDPSDGMLTTSLCTTEL